MKKLYLGMIATLAAFLGADNANAELNFAEAQMQMQEQAKATSKERFDMIEKKNKDYITRDEYVNSTVGQNNMRSNLLFEDMDENKDGKVTLEEYYVGLSIWNYKLLVRVAEAEKAKEEAKAAEAKQDTETQKTSESKSQDK